MAWRIIAFSDLYRSVSVRQHPEEEVDDEEDEYREPEEPESVADIEPRYNVTPQFQLSITRTRGKE